MPAEPLDRLIEAYLDSCKARGLAPSTVENAYGQRLRRVLLPFCTAEGIASVDQLDSRTLDRLSARLLDQGGERGPVSRHTVHSYMRSINHFLAWANREGEGTPARAQLPRLPKRLMDVLSREEIERLEDAAEIERDKLIIRLLGDAGVRVGEVCGLRVNDLLERDRKHYLRVRGKGAKERLVPIPGLFRRLQRYADRTRPSDAVSDRLFLARKRSRFGEYQPLTPSGVQQMVRWTARRAGITKRVHPHLFRHSYATWMLTRGVNPITLADILGHESLEMIRGVYSHLSPSDTYDAMLRVIQADS